MNIAMGNLPVIFLVIIAIGVGIIVASVILLAGIHDKMPNITENNEKMQTAYPQAERMEELFNYFLEEEEKKNNAFRQMVLDDQKQQNKKGQTEKASHPALKGPIDQSTFNEIIRRYEQGEGPQDIAKSLKKGIGEVKLIISLYSMRD